MTEQETPFFSVIIPTYARPGPLAACLESLTRTGYPRHRFEVIVVDDGSGNPPEAVVDACRDRLDVTLMVQPHAGPAAARNAGAAHARGEYLAFTDDDCLPSPVWLLAFASRFAKVPGHALTGRTLNALTGNRYATASQLLISYLYAYYNAEPGQGRFFTSNNLALPAAEFLSIGGFDTTFPRASAEDRELCDRWLQSDHAITYAPEALIYHAHALTLRTFWRQHFNYGRGAFHFHKIRAARDQERIKVEPLSFYWDLLRYPVSRGLGWRGPHIAMLLAVSQIANTLGFFRDSLIGG